MALPSEYGIYNVRQLLERLTYLGPAQEKGDGVTKSYDWSGAVSRQAVWTPNSGANWIISHIVISSNTATDVTLFEVQDSLANRVAKVYLSDNGNECLRFPIPRVANRSDSTLYITTNGGSGSVTVYGWESGSAGTTTSTSTSSSSSTVSTSTVSSSSSSISVSSSSSSSSSVSVSSSSSSSSSISTSTSTSSSISVSISSSSSSSSSISSSSSSSSSITQTSTG